MMDLDKGSTVEIPASKGKLILLILLSAGLAIYGIASTHAMYSYLSEMGVVGPGLYMELSRSILVTGVGAFCALAMFSKFVDRKPGLIIDSEGLMIRSGLLPAGIVHWDEIKGFSIVQLKLNNFMFIHLKDLEQYIKRVNIFRQINRRLNNAIFGTPLFIASNTLAISIDELHLQCVQRLVAYQAAATPPAVDTPPAGAV